MFKNKHFEVKVVEDKPVQEVVVTEKTPVFTIEKIEIVKSAVKIAGAYFLAGLVIGGITQVAVANQENRSRED